MVGLASYRLLTQIFFAASCILACACTAQGATGAAEFCPTSVVLDTVSVRVYENSDAASEQLHAACQSAASQALTKWQQELLAHAPNHPCLARLRAQGCLVGTPSTSLKCTSTICPTSQKCNIVLVQTNLNPR